MVHAVECAFGMSARNSYSAGAEEQHFAQYVLATCWSCRVAGTAVAWRMHYAGCSIAAAGPLRSWNISFAEVSAAPSLQVVSLPSVLNLGS